MKKHDSVIMIHGCRRRFISGMKGLGTDEMKVLEEHQLFYSM